MKHIEKTKKTDDLTKFYDYFTKVGNIFKAVFRYRFIIPLVNISLLHYFFPRQAHALNNLAASSIKGINTIIIYINRRLLYCTKCLQRCLNIPLNSIVCFIYCKTVFNLKLPLRVILNVILAKIRTNSTEQIF